MHVYVLCTHTQLGGGYASMAYFTGLWGLCTGSLWGTAQPNCGRHSNCAQVNSTELLQAGQLTDPDLCHTAQLSLSQDCFYSRIFDISDSQSDATLVKLHTLK